MRGKQLDLYRRDFTDLSLVGRKWIWDEKIYRIWLRRKEFAEHVISNYADDITSNTLQHALRMCHRSSEALNTVENKVFHKLEELPATRGVIQGELGVDGMVMQEHVQEALETKSLSRFLDKEWVTQAVPVRNPGSDAHPEGIRQPERFPGVEHERAYSISEGVQMIYAAGLSSGKDNSPVYGEGMIQLLNEVAEDVRER